MNAIDRLDAARSALSEDAARALRLLPSASRLPQVLRVERDLVAAEGNRAMGFFSAAEALYSSVLARARGAAEAALRAEAALGSASGLRALGNTAAASRRLVTARAAARSSGLAGFGERLELEEALVLRAEEHYGEAVSRLLPLLSKALRRRAYDEAAFLLWAIGGARRFQGRLAEAEAAFRRSFSLAHRAGDPAGQGYALFGIGGAARVRGDLKGSERAYGKAAQLFAGSSDLFACAYAACGRANALRQLGRLGEAERGYRRAHALYSRLGDAVDLAYVDWGWGEVLLRRGALQAALKRLSAAEGAFRSGGETRGVVLSLQSRARLLHSLGRTPQAERLFARGLALARKAGIHTHLEFFT